MASPDDLIEPHTITLGVLKTGEQGYKADEFPVHGKRKEDFITLKAQLEWDATGNLSDEKGGARLNASGYFVVRVRDMKSLGYTTGTLILQALSRSRLIKTVGPAGNSEVVELEKLAVYVYFTRAFGAMGTGSGFVECKFMDRAPQNKVGG